MLALEHSGPAIYSIVDDDPAPVREWLSVLANALGAKPPRHTPTWLARLFAVPGNGDPGHPSPRRLQHQGKTRLGWTPRYPTWRHGFPATYSAIAIADRQAA